MLSFAESIKIAMYTSLYLPWGRIIICGIVAAAIVMKILISYNEGLEYFIFSSKYLRFLQELLTIMLLYGTSPYLQNTP